MLEFKHLGLAGVLLTVVVGISSALASTQQRDPTRPPQQSATVAQPQQTLQLTMIQSQGTSAWALVNGQRVRVGDTVAGYKVLSIDATKVRLALPQANTTPLVLTLFPSIKQRGEQGDQR